MFAIRFTVLFVFAAVATVAVYHPVAAEQLWSLKLDQLTSWRMVAADGSLIVATPGQITSYDADSGDIRWTRSDIQRSIRSDLIALGSADLTLVQVFEPPKKKSRRARKKNAPSVWHAIDITSGETRWQLGGHDGKLAAVHALPEQDMFLAFYDFKAKKRKDSGVLMEGRKLSSGELVWRTKYTGAKAKLLGSPYKAGGYPGLVRYAGAVIDGGDLFVPYLGVHAYDIQTGDLLWGKSFSTADKSLRRVSSPPVVTDDVVYAAGGGVIKAFDRANGNELWTTKVKRSPAVSGLYLAGDMLLARLGGVFSTGGKLQGKKPYGVIALDRASGKIRWRYDDAEGGVTNLITDEDNNLVVFADGVAVIGLRLSSGIPEFETPLQFYRLYGIFDTKSSGFSIGGGFSKSSSAGGSKGGGGMLGFGGSGADIGDLPLETRAQPKGREVILRGQHSVLAFDPKVRLIQWSAIFGATGLGDVHLLKTGQLPDYSLKGRSYYLTVLEDGKNKRRRQILSLLGVSRRSGKVVSRTDIGGKDPKFLIDHERDRMFRFVPGKKKTVTIVAYGL